MGPWTPSPLGEYQLELEVLIVVTLEDGKLFAQPTGRSKLAIFAESETRFFLRAVPAPISFTRDDSGAVTGLVVHQGGREQPARKVR